jgi:hypothetical protein
MTREPQRVGFSLLSEWWCVPADMTEPEQDAFLRELARQVMTPNVIPICLVRDRLFGGFRCAESGRIHVGFLTGCYTYTNPELNEPMGEAYRAEKWAELLAENTGDHRWMGHVGPFTQGAPEPAPAQPREEAP